MCAMCVYVCMRALCVCMLCVCMCVYVCAVCICNIHVFVVCVYNYVGCVCMFACMSLFRLFRDFNPHATNLIYYIVEYHLLINFHHDYLIYLQTQS